MGVELVAFSPFQRHWDYIPFGGGSLRGKVILVQHLLLLVYMILEPSYILLILSGKDEEITNHVTHMVPFFLELIAIEKTS